jgi:hypothetical protein
MDRLGYGNIKESTWTTIQILFLVTILVIILYRIATSEERKKSESNFRGHGGGGHHGGGGFHHGGRGGWGGGYWGYPYPYDDEPVIVVNSGNCPEGWIWMGAMLGCQKPQGM